MELVLNLALMALIVVVCALLPASPFTYSVNFSEYADWFGIVNYFVPISTFLSIMEAWLVAVTGWYVLQAFARWTKVTD